jgi:hypothetical protein
VVCRWSAVWTLLAAIVLTGCAAQPNKPTRALTAEEANDIAKQAVSQHGLSTDAINQTRFYLQHDGPGWRVAAIFPNSLSSDSSHAIISINKNGKVTSYSTR